MSAEAPDKCLIAATKRWDSSVDLMFLSVSLSAPTAVASLTEPSLTAAAMAFSLKSSKEENSAATPEMKSYKLCGVSPWRALSRALYGLAKDGDADARALLSLIPGECDLTSIHADRKSMKRRTSITILHDENATKPVPFFVVPDGKLGQSILNDTSKAVLIGTVNCGNKHVYGGEEVLFGNKQVAPGFGLHHKVGVVGCHAATILLTYKKARVKGARCGTAKEQYDNIAAFVNSICL